MNRFKRLAMAAAILIGASSFAAAAAAPDWLNQPLKKPLDQLVIGLSFPLLDPWSASYEKNFQDYAKALGVKVIVLDSQADVLKQSNDIRDLVAQGVDTVIALPLNNQAIVSSLGEAHAAGIPVVLSNGRVAPSGAQYVTAWTGPDHFKTGYLSGQMLIEALGDKANIVIISGTPGTESGDLREKGCRTALSEHPGATLLDAQPANFKREKAQSIMEAFITRFGNKIDGVCANDDDMALGALTAIKAAVQAGRLKPDHIKITSGASQIEGYDEIKKNGYFYGSVLMQPDDASRLALKTAVEVAEGQKVAKEQYYDTPAYTLKNIDGTPRPTY
ncbi:sugar ABC transporter substrate-binding protein [Sodalis sp. RH16]|uniref:sugar ABC transporter substrate-binding protein n=1 Tax=Sodalis sp. RH16 TaxID=3394331 RepID=UPI0039B56472